MGVDRVVMPTTQTVAVRMPARMMGAASGSSTLNRDWRGVMPTPLAAISTAGSRPCNAVTTFRRIGSMA